MTHAQMKEEIREACAKANPEIRELRFGCVIRDKGSHETGDWIFLNKHTDSGMLHVFRKSSGSGFGKVEEFEIIGRPVRLADVLVSHRQKYIPKYEEEHSLQVIQIIDGENAWDLLRDDLDLQKGATVEFIRSLIKE